MPDVPVDHDHFFAHIVPVIVQEFVVQVGRAAGMGLAENADHLAGNIQNLAHAEVVNEIAAGVTGIGNEVEVVFPAPFQDHKGQPAISDALIEFFQHLVGLVWLKDCQGAAHSAGLPLVFHGFRKRRDFAGPCQAVQRLKKAGMKHGGEPVQAL